MRRDKTMLGCVVGLLGVLAVPAVASASEPAAVEAAAEQVTVALYEDGGGVTLQIRGVTAPTHDHVVTSKTGALLFVRGDDATAQRLHPMGKHRLRFVQIGRAGERVAVRVVQRKAARGNLSKYLETVVVPGGFDVRIDDSHDAPVPTTAVATVAAVAAVEPAPIQIDRAAALQKLAGDAATLDAQRSTLNAQRSTLDAQRSTLNAESATPSAVNDAIVAAPANTPTTPATVAADAPAIATASSDVGDTTIDDGARWAGAGTQDAAAVPFDLRKGPPRVGLAWLATAMLAFSGLGLVWWRRRRPLLTTPDALRVVARVSIGPKQQILWLSAGGRTLLVGATEHRIELLAELDGQSPAAVDPLSLFATTPTVPPRGTPSIGNASPENAPASPLPAGNRVAAFKQRLRAALGDELAGRGETDPGLPAHLEMLAGEPRWARKDAA